MNIKYSLVQLTTKKLLTNSRGREFLKANFDDLTLTKCKLVFVICEFLMYS